MKGIIFTEFLELVESAFSPEVADRIIEASDLPSGGAYTAVGSYDHAEIVSLVLNLSKETGTPVPDLLRTFGRHLFGQFPKVYPHFFEDTTDAFDFLASVENYIHVEVRKLYPDAELPSLDCEARENGTMVMVYRSSRGLADVAHGLIEGCFDHFGQPITIEREDLSGGSNTEVRFRISA